MNFIFGFEKAAGAVKGLIEAGNETIKDVLRLKGMREAVKGIRTSYKGKMGDVFKTPQGRKDLAHAVTKSLPSAAAATAYGYAGKKSMDKMREDNQNSYDAYYNT